MKEQTEHTLDSSLLALLRKQAADCSRWARWAGWTVLAVLIAAASAAYFWSINVALSIAGLAAFPWGLGQWLHGRASGIRHVLRSVGSRPTDRTGPAGRYCDMLPPDRADINEGEDR